MSSIAPTASAQGELHRRVHRALKAVGHPAPGEQPLAGLRLFQDALGEDQGPHHALVVVLGDALAELKGRHADAAALLNARFFQDRTAADVASKLGVSEAELYRRQQRAITQLAVVLTQREGERLLSQRAAALARLEAPTYAELVGVEAHLDQLQQAVTAGDGPRLLCITGLGGIGKTALADALVRRLIDHNLVWGLAWTTARPRNYRLDGSFSATAEPALTSAALVEALWNQLLPDLPLPLKDQWESVIGELELRLLGLQRTFAVIDNLETVIDLADLVPVLRRLSSSVRIILTSRASLPGEGYVYHYPLRELSEVDALQLLRREARVRNVTHLLAAPDDDLRRIVGLVGGHPLALRLIVGRIQLHALDDVLGEVALAEGQSVENLYTHVYWQAWRGLPELERSVLLAMAQVAPAGAGLDLLAAMTGLDRPPLRGALDGLMRVNLIDRRGDLQTSRYSIHSLTRTFLLKQVLDW